MDRLDAWQRAVTTDRQRLLAHIMADRCNALTTERDYWRERAMGGAKIATDQQAHIEALTAERDAERALADELAECLAEMAPSEDRHDTMDTYFEAVLVAQALARWRAARETGG